MTNSKTYIGIDNGVTGAIGILRGDGTHAWLPTPVFKCLSYQKAKRWISRVDTHRLFDLLREELARKAPCLVMLERPFTNLLECHYNTVVSAARSLEATLLVLEGLKVPFQYLDSRTWQKELLPEGLKGAELKVASKAVAHRLFPDVICKTDGDAMLIAEYARRHAL